MNRPYNGKHMNMLKLVYKSIWRLIPTGLLIVIVAFYIVNRPGKKPIRVGFAAQLTGIQAELGVQERNGVQLAVEKINTAGGVAGRPIELIVQDDLGTPEGAQAADRKLIQAGVVTIIGYATSEQNVLAVALKKTDGHSEGLAQALIEIDSFNGLRDVFSFNKYGDVLRPAYLGVIRDGKFVDIKTMTPAKP